MKTTLYYIKPYIGKMMIGFLIKFIGTIMDLVLPWILSYLVDEVCAHQNMGEIVFFGFVMVFCSILAVVFNVWANRMAAKVARDVTSELRRDLFWKMEQLSVSQVDALTIPSLISRMTTDTYNINNVINSIQRIGVRAPLLLMGGIIITMIIDPVLATALIILLPIVVLLVWLVNKKGLPLYQKVQTSTDQMIRIARENLTGVRVVKALSMEGYEQQRFEGVSETLSKGDQKAQYVMNVLNPSLQLLLNIGLVIVILIGGYRVHEGIIPSGKIIAFMTYFLIILNSMMSITRVFITISKASASDQRISEVMQSANALQERNNQAGLVCNHHICFQDVTFSYTGKGDHIKNVSFVLEKGQTLGIIGGTGSGKSTIVSLLMRYYDIDWGAIMLDGKDIRLFSLAELRLKFGVVFQNDFLLSGTIYENIDFERQLSFAQIKKAATVAQAAAFIEALPDGYQTLLGGKGNTLSGGQRGRLLIARALAEEPEILILDDASSALDYKTDSMFRKALAASYKDVTKIVIAQRISSVMHADHIIVLDEGQIVGSGTHEWLLHNCQIYQEIAVTQLGGDFDE